MNQRLALDRVQAWAQSDENIRAVVLTGSVALGEGESDPLSDLDVEIYAVDTSPLLDDSEWYRRFGEVLVVEELENPGWCPTRLIYFVDGKIDFAIADISVLRKGAEYTRPFRVLLDKDRLTGSLRLVPLRTEPPTAEEFDTCINCFYAAALMCAKAVVRDEPWIAKVRDRDLKRELLRMIEWDHKSRHGWDYDTWHLGAHMRRWMDPDVVEALNRCWAGFSPEETRQGLASSVDLYDTLSSRTAQALGLEAFPSAKVREEMQRILRHEAQRGQEEPPQRGQISSVGDSGFFDERVAARYDEDSAEMFDPAIMEPAVDFLADLAGSGRALELGIGTGRIALPLAARGVPVHGIDLSEAMVARLRAKPGGEAIGVTIGDFASTRVEGSFSIAYLVYNAIMNLRTQEAQVACFRNVAAHLEPGGFFVIEVMVPELQRLPPGETARVFHISETRWGIDEYDVATQGITSHHLWSDGRVEHFPCRYVWPSELDLMAELAGLRLRERLGGWKREPSTSESRMHVSVWEKPPV